MKDEILKAKRNVSFEDVITAIKYWQAKYTPNPKLWRENQGLIIFIHNNYPHICPYVLQEWWIFLKTIYPDRDYKNFI